MSLFETITQEIKKAMLAREKGRLEALRSVKAAFMMAKTEKGASHILSEEEELKIIQKMVKQRLDSAAIYKEQGRDDLYQMEMEEYRVIEAFMPAQLTEAELRAYLGKLVSDMGADSMQQMGSVMGRATSELSGRADGKMISTIVRQLLSSS
ncbi:MAG: GatB/YqeY domain-containing protein [Bacteroidales bacterium]